MRDEVRVEMNQLKTTICYGMSFLTGPAICRTKRCRKYLLRFCLIVALLIFVYLCLPDKYHLIFESIEIPLPGFFSSHRTVYSMRALMKREKYTLRMRQTFPQPLFQSRIHPSHPHFPTHIYTQNITSLQNTTKLILLGNAFFGDKEWGINSNEKSSAELMNQLSCPFLSDYCDVTSDQKLFAQADAVVYHVRDDINIQSANKNRHSDQRFVLALWESPLHTPDLTAYRNFFNWTMTYRLQSHIVASYYSANGYIHKGSDYYRFLIKEYRARNLTLQLQKNDHRPSDTVLQKKKLGTAAAIISNCRDQGGRMTTITELNLYIDVTVYGKCGQACPENVDCRVFVAQNYYFFLSFENSLCTDYATEKFFSTIGLPIVPVVLGRSNYSYFIPSSGYINTNDFANITSLARYLNQTRYDKEKYLSYFSWKRDFFWGVSGTLVPLCDLCLRLHLDTTPNVIENIHAWWHDNTCVRPQTFKHV